MWGDRKEAKRLAAEAHVAVEEAEPQHARSEELGEELTKLKRNNHFSSLVRRALS